MTTPDPFDAWPATGFAGNDDPAVPRGLPDPFDAPAFDPATGELLDTTPTPEPVVLPPAPAGSAELVPQTLVDQVAGNLAAAAADVPAFAGELRRALELRVAMLYSGALEARPDGAVTEAVVAPELRLLGDLYEVLSVVGKAFTASASIARGLAGEVVLEVRKDRDIERAGGSASVRVAAGRPGGDLKVTTTQPTEVHTDTPGIVDVLVAYLLERAIAGSLDRAIDAEAYATGARAMAAELLGLDGEVGLLASPKWKSTALDLLRRRLEVDAAALAVRLDAAYHRRPVGEVRVEVEQVPASKRTRTV